MHIHKYGKWVDKVGTFDSPLFPKLGTWKEAIQIKRCKTCNKVKMRRP